jgi:hypothetical protein
MSRRIAIAVASACMGLAALSSAGALDFTGFQGRFDLTKNLSASDQGGSSWLDIRIGCGSDIGITNYLRLTAVPEFAIRLYDLSGTAMETQRPSPGVVDDSTTLLGLGLSLHAKLETPMSKWYAFAGPRVGLVLAAWKSTPSVDPSASADIVNLGSSITPLLVEAQAGFGRRFGALFAAEIAGCYEILAVEKIVPPSQRFALSFRALISADLTRPASGYWQLD